MNLLSDQKREEAAQVDEPVEPTAIEGADGRFGAARAPDQVGGLAPGLGEAVQRDPRGPDRRREGARQGREVSDVPWQTVRKRVDSQLSATRVAPLTNGGRLAPEIGPSWP